MASSPMHFEILIEDQSGETLLHILFPKMIGDGHTFRVIRYNGIGKIPENLKPSSNSNKRMLANQLPRLLRGYGSTYSQYKDYSVVVVVIMDLDDKCLVDFRNELDQVLNACNPKPDTLFCLAIEEGEAWLLGDINAVKQAFPTAKTSILTNYVNDSICGTWEILADAVYPGGSAKLKPKGYPMIGVEKCSWASKIAPYLDIDHNKSPSFQYFRKKIQERIKSI